MIHRDIKPGNLLLDRQGVVKILDMGLACFQESQRKASTKPSERIMVGTDDRDLLAYWNKLEWVVTP